MAELMDWAQRAGFCELYLATGVDERAKGIYTRHGFVDIEFDEQHRNYLMGCTLRRPLFNGNLDKDINVPDEQIGNLEIQFAGKVLPAGVRFLHDTDGQSHGRAR
jgi:hypothetical protein